MESSESSNDSFVWTHASNESSDSSPTIDMAKTSQQDTDINIRNKSRGTCNTAIHSDNCQDIKKKKTKNKGHEANIIKRDTPKQKKIKLEQENDIEIDNKNQDNSASKRELQDISLHDNNYLHLKAKEENNFDKVTSNPSLNTDIHNDEISDSEYLNRKVKQEASCPKSKRNELFDNIKNASIEVTPKQKKKHKHRFYEDDHTDMDDDNNAKKVETDTRLDNLSNHINKDSLSASLLKSSKTNKIKNANGESTSEAEKDIDSQTNEDAFCTSTAKLKQVLEVEESIKCKNRNDNTPNQKFNASSTREDSLITTVRLSDRILFENDSESDQDAATQNSKKSTSSKYINNFLNNNQSLKPISEDSFNYPALTPEDDVWLLKCPKEIGIHNFNSCEIILDSRCKMKVKGDTYYGTLDDNTNRVTVMSCEQSKFVIKNIPSKGVINFRRRIPRPILQSDTTMLNQGNNFIPLPETKCRHPLFGLHYKKAIKIPKQIAQRLNLNYNETIMCKKENKKHIFHKHLKEEPFEHVNGETALESNAVKKKSKKRKHSEDTETLVKKKKRVKSNRVATEVWDSEKAIEDNLFNY